MIKRQQCLDTPTKLTVTAWRDPLIEGAGHRPGSPYVEAAGAARIFKFPECASVTASRSSR